MTIIDPEKQKQAKEYSRISRRLWLVETAFSLAYTLAWLGLGWAIGLRQWLTQNWSLMSVDWFIVPVFVLIFGGISALIELPLSYYTGFVLPHRFDQSNQTLKDWLIDQFKGLAISLPIGLIVLELLYLALRVTGSLWWLWAAGGLLVFQVILANLAPVLIMPIFNKYVPLGEEHAELAERLLKLAEKSNTKVKGVFKFDMSRRTKAANAALTGIGNTRRIVLGDTLINEFTLDEIETVLAHELGHHVNRDIPFLMGFGALVTTLGLYLASLALTWAVSAFGFTNEYQSQEGIYLRARTYSPATGRFLTRDTWAGSASQPISYNRWVYANANPINLSDPTGRMPSYCAQFNLSYWPTMPGCGEEIDKLFGLNILDISGTWDVVDKAAVRQAALLVGSKFAVAMGGFITPSNAFKQVYGIRDNQPMLFNWWGNKCHECRPLDCQTHDKWEDETEVNDDGKTVYTKIPGTQTDCACKPKGGYTSGERTIKIASLWPNFTGHGQYWQNIRKINNVIHELGHAFNQRAGQDPENVVGTYSKQVADVPFYLNSRHAGFYLLDSVEAG